MKLLIDLQACQGESSFRGIGFYSLSLAISIAKIAKERGDEIWLLFNDQYEIENIIKKFSEWIEKDRIVIFVYEDAVKAIKNREDLIKNISPDILHITDPFGGFLDNVVISVPENLCATYTAITLYDLIPYVHPELYLVDEGYKKFYLNRLDIIKKADLFLAISEYSRNEAIELLGLELDNVINISAAVGEQFQKLEYSQNEQDNLLAQFGIHTNFIFYVPGGFDPRKNFDRLLNAYAELEPKLREKHQLVIGSKVDENMRQDIINKAVLLNIDENSIVLTGYLQEESLIMLYNLCKIYVFPSIHEGFGLPALEAMACGSPVIGSNTTSVPEVIGYSEALFDPYDIQSMFNKLHLSLTDENFISSLKIHSVNHIKQFSWDNSAIKALNVFENFLNQKKESKKLCQ